MENLRMREYHEVMDFESFFAFLPICKATRLQAEGKGRKH
jgi:hypothetical protein